MLSRGKQILPVHLPGALVISSIAIHASGHQELSLGRVLVASGSDWVITKPLRAVVVPHGKLYVLGMVLDKIPEDAIPVDKFFVAKHS